ncbi:hypothetical protein COB72_01190 [bacterium]|nr:MAG: hypothetical protein COB72_01190 [bacterium]
MTNPRSILASVILELRQPSASELSSEFRTGVEQYLMLCCVNPSFLAAHVQQLTGHFDVSDYQQREFLDSIHYRDLILSSGFSRLKDQELLVMSLDLVGLQEIGQEISVQSCAGTLTPVWADFLHSEHPTLGQELPSISDREISTRLAFIGDAQDSVELSDSQETEPVLAGDVWRGEGGAQDGQEESDEPRSLNGYPQLFVLEDISGSLDSETGSKIEIQVDIQYGHQELVVSAFLPFIDREITDLSLRWLDQSEQVLGTAVADEAVVLVVKSERHPRPYDTIELSIDIRDCTTTSSLRIEL